ncbi:MAG: hypothetical protein LC793_12485, partial [Thermomicrobia bacterium]|nr:hypothetical protein [Thermomicrobia bacterium]
MTGILTASVALLGFGINVALDALASSIIVWRFLTELPGGTVSERVERQAGRIINLTLLAAGLYIAFQALRSLLAHTESETAVVG